MMESIEMFIFPMEKWSLCLIHEYIFIIMFSFNNLCSRELWIPLPFTPKACKSANHVPCISKLLKKIARIYLKGYESLRSDAVINLKCNAEWHRFPDVTTKLIYLVIRNLTLLNSEHISTDFSSWVLRSHFEV